MSDRIFNVLFLCTGNSARSILAEALLNHYGHGRFRAFSAGSHPSGEVQPMALASLKRWGIPAVDFSSKSWNQFAESGAPELDFVITVCDNAAGEACPVWPGQPLTAHWGVEDPVAASPEKQLIAFSSVFAILERRIKLFVELPIESLSRLVLEKTMKDIGQSLPDNNVPGSDQGE